MDFREASDDDRDAILALRRAAFPDHDREKQQPDFWRWEFRDGYAGPARIFVAETGGRIVGHFACVPQNYQHEGRAIRGALAVDAMTHPDHHRQRVFSRLAVFAAERLRREFQLVTAFQIREAVAAGMEAGGWRAIASAPVLLRPVLGVRPTETKPCVAVVDRFLNTAAVRQPRTLEFFEWRYLKNPHWQYAIEQDENAFLVYRDTVLKGIRTMAIADCGGEPRALRSLLRHAWSNALQRRVILAAAMMTRDHPAYRTLRRAGFFPGPHRFRLLLQVFDTRLSLPASWSLSWGDTDHL